MDNRRKSKHSLTRTLLSWFLILALTPLLIIGSYEYYLHSLSGASQGTDVAKALFGQQILIILIVTIGLVFFVASLISHRIVRPLKKMTKWMNHVASGDLTRRENIDENNEIGELALSFQSMTEQLQQISVDNSQRSWHQTGIARLNETVRGEQAMSELCRNIVTVLCRYMELPMGAMYILRDGRRLQMMGSFALSMRKKLGSSFALGEGLPGQAALEKKAIVAKTPEDYFTLESGLGSQLPTALLVQPVIYDDEIKGIMEFALTDDIEAYKKEFLQAAMETIAVAINSTQVRERVQELLDKTTHQAQTLQQQQEELQSANEELKHQSDELQHANSELEEKGASLLKQKEEIVKKNREIEESRKDIERKAAELEQASRYKSEFLANMSHELRTPLNSMLILARMLEDNDDGNLTEDQVESAQVINRVGHDLLDLINDILDLSKVEAGKLSVNLEPVDLRDIVDQLKAQFQPLAKDRKLGFRIDEQASADIDLETDRQRVMQILKNLLSNAFKFTEKGEVVLTLQRLPAGNSFNTDPLNQHGAFSLSVKDSGIGIPKEKQDAIFEAFQQADGSTSRKYGGTGLGLSIAREMAALLGGEMTLESEAGKGATFSLLLPAKISEKQQPEREQVADPVQKPSAAASFTAPERDKAEHCSALSGKKILLVDDDLRNTFALSRALQKYGMDIQLADNGELALEKLADDPDGIELVLLDIMMPVMDGFQAIEQIRKQNHFQRLPVIALTAKAMSEDKDKCLEAGFSDYLTKPVDVEELVSRIQHWLIPQGKKEVISADSENR